MRASCSICSGIFSEKNDISATSCGHVCHSDCLTLQVSQSENCPICHAPINPEKVVKLFFNFIKTANAHTSVLESEILKLKAKLSAKDIELVKCKKQKETTRAFVKVAEKKTADLQQAAYEYESTIAELRLKVKSSDKLEAKVLKFEQMNTALTNDLQTFNNVHLVVSGTKKDFESVLQECGNGSESSKALRTYCFVLKKELEKVIDSKKVLHELCHKLKQENSQLVAKVKFYEDALSSSPQSESFHERSPNSIAFKASNFGAVKAGSSVSSLIASQRVSDNSDCIDTSPLSGGFNNLSFNMSIVAPSKISKKSEESLEVKKFANAVSSFNVKGQNDESSVKRIGYNGLGGHSSTINASGLKKIRSLKRKI